MKKPFSIILPLFMILFFLCFTSCENDAANATVTDDNAAEDQTAESITKEEDTTEEITEKETVPPAVTLDPASLSGAKKEAYLWCDGVFESAVGGKETVAAPSVNWSEVYAVMSNQMDRYYRHYLSGKMSLSQLETMMNAFATVKEASGIALGYLDAAKQRTVSDPMAKAEEWIGKENFREAALCLSKASSKKKAKELVSKNSDAFQKGVTEAVTDFMVRYKISEGKAFLQGLKGVGIDPHIEKEENRLEDYRAFQEDGLVECSVLNTLENIYTHCLIAFPEINFASERTYRWCGDDCLTVGEFKSILNSLYEKGYIIVDADLFYNEESDTPVTKLPLPPGKKPLLLTYDDVTYDSRKMGRGMVDKLILDESGRVCTYTKQKNGAEIISYDNEIFPIIAAFCREHPDFTFRGAKGTLFFTGFDGICGYRSQSEPVNDAEAALQLNRQEEVRKAKAVIEALRDEGFSFGSHSYNHYTMPKYSPSELRLDTSRWLEEVGAIVGETKLFCWPYGGHTLGNVSLRSNAEHKYLFDSGFKFFFGCGAGRYLANEPDGNGIFSDRKAITGEILYFYQMGNKTYLREYSYLFDPNSIWDPARVPYRYHAPYDASKDMTKQ